MNTLSSAGGTPTNEDKGREFIGQLDPAKNSNNYFAALAYLRARPDANGRTGYVDFYWGGGMAKPIDGA